MKIVDFDTIVSKPVTLRHVADDTLLFKNNTESFDFGLQLKSYRIFDRLRDRKTNFQTAYFLSDLQSLSSIVELRSPYTFYSDNQFTTYLKYNHNYIKVDTVNTALTYSTNFNKLDSNYFFTINLSTNRFLYLTKEIDNSTYYAYCSSESIYLSSGQPSLSAHLFEYVLEDNKLKLFPYRDLQYPNNKYQVILTNTLQLTSTDAGNSVSSVFEVSRNVLTKNRKNLNNVFSFYLGSFNSSDVALNLDTSTNYVSNNYLGFTSLYTMDYCDMMYPNDTTVGFDIIPLKNQSTIEEINVPSNHYNSEPDYLNRSYDKIFSGLNENYGYDKIYLTYNTGTKDVHFPPSRLTYFTTPSTIAPYDRLNINDSKIGKIGGVAGDNPLIADKVFKRRLDVKNNNFTDDVNATYLCSWLSGNEAGEQLWVDRYYNPEATDFSSAFSGSSFYTTVTNANMNTTYVFDISSRLTFEGNNDYAYYHIGEQDYESYINTLKDYNLTDNLRVLTFKGASAPYTYDKNDLVLNCNGDRFGKFTTDHTGDMCFSFWLSADDYTKPLGYSLLGNYFEEGFGIFNTDYVTPNILLPFENKVLFLNNDLEIYDELEIFEEDKPVEIKGIARKDNFDQFYVLGKNNIIYVYNSSPNLITKLNVLANKNVTVHDMDVTENKIYVALGNNKLYFFNFDNNTSYDAEIDQGVEFKDDKQKLYIKPNRANSIIFTTADANIATGNETAVDNNDVTYTIRQKLPDVENTPYNFIYKGQFVSNNTNSIEVSGGNFESVVTNVIVDDEDNLITIYDNNRIARLKTNRELISFKDLTFIQPDSTLYLDVILDFEEDVYKKYYLIVEKRNSGASEGYTYLHKIDKDFNLVLSKNIGQRAVNSLALTKSITSFYYLKKYKASKSKFKVILKTKPKFSKTGTFKKSKSVITYDITKLSSGYNHFAVNINLTQGWMDLYINGRKVERAAFQGGSFLLDNPLGSGIFLGALSTPYYLTFAGRLQQQRKYFLKNINFRGFRLYKKALEYKDISVLYNYHNLNRDAVWSIPVGQRTYVDTIDQVFKFNVPEKNTSYYDIEIHNLNIANKFFNNKLQEEIYKELKNIIPYYDEIVGIKADPAGTTPEDCNIIVEDRLKVISNVFPGNSINNEPPVLRCLQLGPDSLNGTIWIGTNNDNGTNTNQECCLKSPGENVFSYDPGVCPEPVPDPQIEVELDPQPFCLNGEIYNEAIFNDTIIKSSISIRTMMLGDLDKFKLEHPNFTAGDLEAYGRCCLPDINNPYNFIKATSRQLEGTADYVIEFPGGECTSTTITDDNDVCVPGTDGYGRMSISNQPCCIKDGVTRVGPHEDGLCDDKEPGYLYCDGKAFNSGRTYQTVNGEIACETADGRIQAYGDVTDAERSWVGKPCCMPGDDPRNFSRLEEGSWCHTSDLCEEQPDKLPDCKPGRIQLTFWAQQSWDQVQINPEGSSPNDVGGIQSWGRPDVGIGTSKINENKDVAFEPVGDDLTRYITITDAAGTSVEGASWPEGVYLKDKLTIKFITGSPTLGGDNRAAYIKFELPSSQGEVEFEPKIPDSFDTGTGYQHQIIAKNGKAFYKPGTGLQNWYSASHFSQIFNLDDEHFKRYHSGDILGQVEIKEYFKRIKTFVQKTVIEDGTETKKWFFEDVDDAPMLGYTTFYNVYWFQVFGGIRRAVQVDEQLATQAPYSELGGTGAQALNAWFGPTYQSAPNGWPGLCGTQPCYGDKYCGTWASDVININIMASNPIIR